MNAAELLRDRLGEGTCSLETENARLRSALSEIAGMSIGSKVGGDYEEYNCWSCEEKVETARKALEEAGEA